MHMVGAQGGGGRCMHAYGGCAGGGGAGVCMHMVGAQGGGVRCMHAYGGFAGGGGRVYAGLVPLLAADIADVWLLAHGGCMG